MSTTTLTEPGTQRATDIFADALVEGVGRATLHLPQIATDPAPEHVHQTRVGLRRTRTLVDAFRPFLHPEWSRFMKREAKALVAGLGPLRDADGTLSRLRKHVAKLSADEQVAAYTVLVWIEERRAQLYTSAVDRLVGGARPERIRSVAEAARHPRTMIGEVFDEAALRDTVAALHDDLRSIVGRVGSKSSLKKLHRVRIGAKRLRYVGEAVAPVLPTADLAAAAEQIQRVLGDLRDASISIERLSDRDPSAGTEALVRAERRAMTDALAKWPKAWERLEEVGKQLP